MTAISDLYKTADWKAEKHVPVIDAPSSAKKGELIKVSVSIGKEVAHPNTTEHHIRWIDVYFLPDGETAPVQIGKAEFTAHGESAKGPNLGSVYTHHEAQLCFKTEKSGTLLACGYCNIHGLWQNGKKIEIA